MIFATPTGRNGSKLAPRRSQDGPKIPQEAPKTAQEAPKTAQETPRRPKTAPRSPRSRPRRPKIPPRRPQDAPRASPRHRTSSREARGSGHGEPLGRRGPVGEGDIGEGLRLEEEFIAVSNTPWAEGPANFYDFSMIFNDFCDFFRICWGCVGDVPG